MTDIETKAARWDAFEKAMRDAGHDARMALLGLALDDKNKAVAAAVLEAYERAAKAIPDTWLDPLLSGPTALIESGHVNIEAFCKALKERILAISQEPPR